MEFQIKLEDIGDFEKKGMPLCNLKEKCWLEFRTYIFLFKFVNFSEGLMAETSDYV